MTLHGGKAEKMWTHVGAIDKKRVCRVIVNSFGQGCRVTAQTKKHAESIPDSQLIYTVYLCLQVNLLYLFSTSVRNTGMRVSCMHVCINIVIGFGLHHKNNIP